MVADRRHGALTLRRYRANGIAMPLGNRGHDQRGEARPVDRLLTKSQGAQALQDAVLRSTFRTCDLATAELNACQVAGHRALPGTAARWAAAHRHAAAAERQLTSWVCLRLDSLNTVQLRPVEDGVGPKLERQFSYPKASLKEHARNDRFVPGRALEGRRLCAACETFRGAQLGHINAALSRDRSGSCSS